MPKPWSGIALGQDFRSIFSHENRVFELSGQLSIASRHGPVIASIKLCESRSNIDHRLNGKTHTGQNSILSTLTIGKVWNVRILMESTTESVSDVFLHDGKSVPRSFRDDSITDHADGATGLESSDGSMHSVERALGDGPRLFGHGTDKIGFGLIRMPSVDDRGNVDVNYVTIFQDIVIGDSVANDIVNACAAAFGVAQIAESRGLVFMFGRIVIDQPINFPS
jgi:hypothetical protein